MMRALLIGLAVILASALALISANSPPSGSVPSTGDARHAISAAVLPDFHLAPERSIAYAEIAARPLFNPGRKPAPTQAVATATEPPKPQIRRGLYELMGVMESPTGRLAQLRELSTRRSLSVRVGDSLQEMNVVRVGIDSVVLGFAGDTDELRLPQFTASGRVPQPPAVSMQAAAPTSAPIQAATPAPAGGVSLAAPNLPNATTAAANQPQVVDERDVRRLEAIAQQNPSNWNRASADSARRRLEQLRSAQPR